jgi:hypothetical protein
VGRITQEAEIRTPDYEIVVTLSESLVHAGSIVVILGESMRHSIALNLSIIVVLGSPVALPVSAQGPAAPRRDPVQERVDWRPVEPAVVEPEPELEAHLAFQRTLALLT